MASLDRERDAVVVRIVYDGPPTAGKTTSVRALAERLGQGGLTTPEEAAGRTLYFDWLEYVGGRFEGRQIRCQVVSVPGQPELAARRHLLLATADAVVFVGDTSRRGYDASRSHLTDCLTRVKVHDVPVGVVLQANKRDLPDAVPLDELRGQGLAVIESIASHGDGIREAFVFAIRLALDRVRELIRRDALLPTPTDESPAESLLHQMRALPIGDARGFELMPSEAPLPSVVSDGPRLPDSTIPSGCLWPPINGRVMLQEATAELGRPAEQAAGIWVAESRTGWRFHSGLDAEFTDHDVARDALLRWAQLHASMTQWLSPHRLVALCETGHGTYRLWQVVRAETSLWTRLVEALSTRDAALIEARSSEAAQLCARAATKWAQAPCELPCTLETVGVNDGTHFIALMPEPQRTRPPEQIDRQAKLWRQLQRLVNTSGFAAAS